MKKRKRLPRKKKAAPTAQYVTSLPVVAGPAHFELIVATLRHETALYVPCAALQTLSEKCNYSDGNAAKMGTMRIVHRGIYLSAHRADRLLLRLLRPPVERPPLLAEAHGLLRAMQCARRLLESGERQPLPHDVQCLLIVHDAFVDDKHAQDELLLQAQARRAVDGGIADALCRISRAWLQKKE